VIRFVLVCLGFVLFRGSYDLLIKENEPRNSTNQNELKRTGSLPKIDHSVGVTVPRGS
jgi:hypothetical protein